MVYGCALSTSPFAQLAPTSVYLAGFRNSKALSSFDTYAQQVRQLNYSLPKVDEINLRTETDQFNLSRQEYALRVMFNGWNAGKSYAGEQEWLTEKLQHERTFTEQNCSWANTTIWSICTIILH